MYLPLCLYQVGHGVSHAGGRGRVHVTGTPFPTITEDPDTPDAVSARLQGMRQSCCDHIHSDIGRVKRVVFLLVTNDNHRIIPRVKIDSAWIFSIISTVVMEGRGAEVVEMMPSTPPWKCPNYRLACCTLRWGNA